VLGKVEVLLGHENTLCEAISYLFKCLSSATS
jgi:hypothetical protein